MFNLPDKVLFPFNNQDLSLPKTRFFKLLRRKFKMILRFTKTKSMSLNKEECIYTLPNASRRIKISTINFKPP